MGPFATQCDAVKYFKASELPHLCLAVCRAQEFKQSLSPVVLVGSLCQEEPVNWGGTHMWFLTTKRLFRKKEQNSLGARTHARLLTVTKHRQWMDQDQDRHKGLLNTEAGEHSWEQSGAGQITRHRWFTLGRGGVFREKRKPHATVFSSFSVSDSSTLTKKKWSETRN